MSKIAWLGSIFCLVIGLAVGYLYGHADAIRWNTNTFVALNVDEVVTAQRNANDAYQNEDAPVAIYALKQAVLWLECWQDFPKQFSFHDGTSVMSNEQLCRYLILNHARLAKLYDESGRTNLATMQLSDALNCAKSEAKFQTITNETALMNWFQKADKAP